jgi:hypothetical protein
MPKPTLTRKEMEEIIGRGESVGFHTPTGFKAVTRVEDLPSDAELAGDDEEQREHVRAAIRAQHAALAAQLTKLDAPARVAKVGRAEPAAVPADRPPAGKPGDKAPPK